VAKRTTVTMDDHDQQTLATVSDTDGPEWAMLVTLAAAHGIALRPGASEATVIRALLRVGADVLREQVMARGYEQLAEMWSEVHDAAEARERRRRYADRIDRVMPG
jgi:hypothetical protein